MIIDCDSCAVRDLHCEGCLVTVLLRAPAAAEDGPAGGIEFDDREQDALAALAGSGLVPPLRLVPAEDPPGPPTAPLHSGPGERRQAG